MDFESFELFECFGLLDFARKKLVNPKREDEKHKRHQA